MRILPIINHEISTYKTNDRGNRMASNSGYAYFIMLKGMTPDSVSFSGLRKAPLTVKEFKKLNPYLTCLYTGKPFFTNEMLGKMQKKGCFKGSISHVVDKLQPYRKDYLEPIEEQVFLIIEKEAKQNPNKTLNELFNDLYKTSLDEIRREQKPFMTHIKMLGENLPDDFRFPFKQYMVIVDKKLNGEPIIQKFSPKEFRYKLDKLISHMPDGSFKKQVIDLEKTFDNKKSKKKSIKDNFLSVFLNVNKRANVQTQQDEDIYASICAIKSLAKTFGYKRLERLCTDNLKMLRQEPVFVPFSNKSFVYDLRRMLDKMPQTRLKEQIIAAAEQLPNSLSSVDALILKFKDADPNLIGERLFSPALVSIEHLHPESKGGPTTVANCALARRGPNSRRKSDDLSETLKQYPLKNQQKYVNKLTVLVKKGLMSKADALDQIETIEREGKIKLNKSKLLSLTD